jgi:hypothetical protein
MAMALLFAFYLLNDGAFVIIAATLARGGLLNTGKCDIYPCPAKAISSRRYVIAAANTPAS